ncbi:MAG TPA: TIGR03667 family PPOX class F420-dependent oxidoreductase [Anaerolineales bacterium]|nr:TIGR03667 family PPOX class F420-dependent oxidoreductase [Anaerolineales bacterium]
MIRFEGSFGRRVRRRLKREKVIWLTTVGRKGTPQPRPVWFVWEERKGTLLLFSQRETRKLEHLKRNRRVAVQFNTDPDGDDVVVFTGEARIDRRHLPAHRVPNYVRKYKTGMRSLGMTPEAFAEEYEVPIRVRLQRLRGW